MSVSKRKTPIVAGLLSMIFPGLGHLYADEKLKGYFCLALTLGVVCMWSFSDIYMIRFFNYGRLTFYLLGLWFCIVGDSYRDAIRYNNRREMQEGFDAKEAWKKLQKKHPFNSPDNPTPPSV